jgi:hypothetical protein
MFEYEVVRIDLKAGFRSMKPKEDYTEIIKRYAKSGYRLVQIFAPPIAGNGWPIYYDLIFERQLEK